MPNTKWDGAVKSTQLTVSLKLIAEQFDMYVISIMEWL